ncbi:MAG: GNAT family N-acetyltransferase [Anaerolineales bacterium]|nr:GNAT family N-acetyltransferase [Anaerolineales bacterium]
MYPEYVVAPDRFAGNSFLLRSYYPGDGPALAEAVNGSYTHLRRFMTWSKPHTSVEEAEVLVRQFRGRYLLAEDFVIGIFDPTEHQLWGGTGFHLRLGPLSEARAEIGMWIRASEVGRGLGAAALRGMIQWGFTVWPWQYLAWRCHSENVASARTALSAGMRLVERRRDDRDEGRADTLIFGMARAEWRGAP